MATSCQPAAASLSVVPRLRLALAQVNPTVGDVLANCAIVREVTERAAARGADLVAFPEMMITGYPIEDLALRPSFQRAAAVALDELAAELQRDGHGEIVVVLGALDHREDGRPLNTAVIVHRGRVVANYAKHHLPNYGVFDEFRYFAPGDCALTARIGGIDVGIVICEDLWRGADPQPWADDLGLLLVLNGSPYEQDKDDVRLQLCQQRAIEAGCPLAYVNMIGGQDELVFDGDSLVVDGDGTLIARARQFVEELLVVDLDCAPGSSADAITVTEAVANPPDGLTPTIAPVLTSEEEVYRALVLGLSDYVTKVGFGSVILGLSGGIDSALVAAIACDAIGADRVYGVSMPSAYSSEHSRDDAADLAERTGLHYRCVPIAGLVDAFATELDLAGLAEENLQARVRGVTLMALSNSEGHLVLATGNKSELAVGYSTIYGDAVGGYAPIKDVPKTLVWRLARWRNENSIARGEIPPIPENSITKPPSAELRPGQLDTDSLPPYDLLDAILDLYVEGDRGADDVIAAGFPADLVERILRMVDAAEYKRRQYPPGTKVSAKAFGRDRRLPITSRWRESRSTD
jgi:NAD+ synthase (glutamine-hydrolysing)